MYFMYLKFTVLEHKYLPFLNKRWSAQLLWWHIPFQANNIYVMHKSKKEHNKETNWQSNIVVNKQSQLQKINSIELKI